MRFENLEGQRVVIWGTGREGRAAYSELERRGIPAEFALTGDGPVAAELTSRTTSGPAALERLATADVIIKSPGVPRTAPELVHVRELGIPVTSLTDLWLSANAERVLAVTGTKGKSTTSALIQHLLVSVGVRASLVGNGGVPVTDGDTADAEIAVTEVSSYQAADLSVSPRLVVVTSLYPEHLPWHGSYEQYVHDKLNLVGHDPEIVVVPDQHGDIAALVRARVGGRTEVVDPASMSLAWSDAGIEWRGVGEVAAADMPVHGRHNHANAALALTAATLGVGGQRAQRQHLLDAVRTFAPLSHRLETVPSQDGRRWVDDSLATAPEAVVAALDTFATSRVTLVLGGSDRGLDFTPLADYLDTRPAEAAVHIIAVGPAGARWLSEGHTDTRLARDFDQAIQWARAEPDGSDVVLLSPGAPSFDEFASYEERSAAFRAGASH